MSSWASKGEAQRSYFHGVFAPGSFEGVSARLKHATQTAPFAQRAPRLNSPQKLSLSSSIASYSFVVYETCSSATGKFPYVVLANSQIPYCIRSDRLRLRTSSEGFPASSKRSRMACRVARKPSDPDPTALYCFGSVTRLRPTATQQRRDAQQRTAPLSEPVTPT